MWPKPKSTTHVCPWSLGWGWSPLAVCPWCQWASCQPKHCPGGSLERQREQQPSYPPSGRKLSKSRVTTLNYKWMRRLSQHKGWVLLSMHTAEYGWRRGDDSKPTWMSSINRSLSPVSAENLVPSGGLVFTRTVQWWMCKYSVPQGASRCV